VAPKLAKQVTIGVCAYNEEENIGDLLARLINNPSPLGLNVEQILVVASGCTDNTVSIVSDYAFQDPRVRIIVENEREGKTRAINQILSSCRTEFLVLIPADVVPSSSAIQLLVEALAETPEVGVVSGHPTPVDNGEGLAAYAVRMIWRMHHHALALVDGEGMGAHATGELMALRRRCVQFVPDDIVNEDAYIGIQAHKNRYKVRYCQDALVYIDGPKNIVEFIRQRRRILTGHLQLKQRTGQFPRTLEAMAVRDLRQVFPILRREFRDYPRDIWRFFVVAMVESVAAALGALDFLRGSVPVRWRKVITSRRTRRCDAVEEL